MIQKLFVGFVGLTWLCATNVCALETMSSERCPMMGQAGCHSAQDASDHADSGHYAKTGHHQDRHRSKDPGAPCCDKIVGSMPVSFDADKRTAEGNKIESSDPTPLLTNLIAKSVSGCLADHPPGSFAAESQLFYSSLSNHAPPRILR